MTFVHKILSPFILFHTHTGVYNRTFEYEQIHKNQKIEFFHFFSFFKTNFQKIKFFHKHLFLLCV